MGKGTRCCNLSDLVADQLYSSTRAWIQDYNRLIKIRKCRSFGFLGSTVGNLLLISNKSGDTSFTGDIFEQETFRFIYYIFSLHIVKRKLHYVSRYIFFWKCVTTALIKLQVLITQHIYFFKHLKKIWVTLTVPPQSYPPWPLVRFYNSVVVFEYEKMLIIRNFNSGSIRMFSEKHLLWIFILPGAPWARYMMNVNRGLYRFAP